LNLSAGRRAFLPPKGRHLRSGSAHRQHQGEDAGFPVTAAAHVTKPNLCNRVGSVCIHT
jgi:hypothetical protein